MKRRFLILLLCVLLPLTLARGEVVVVSGMFSDVPTEGESIEGDTADDTGEAPDKPGSAALIETTAGWPRMITVTVGGDCTLGCTVAQSKRNDGFDAVIAREGLAWPFSGILHLLEEDDLTLVNFEGTLTESTDRTEGKLFNFKGPAEYAKILTLGSVEAVNLANNHFHDYGDQGKADTRDALDAEGIVHSGNGELAVYEAHGVLIGMTGYTFPYNQGKKDISQDVQALRDMGCQIVIASFHWGSEYEKDFSGDQRRIGRAAIDAGADVVVGHHPHIVQGIEKYNGRYILYSLGNLVFGGNTSPDDRDSYLARLTFTVSEDGSEAPALTILPLRLTAQKSGTDYRPVPAEGAEADRIIKRILDRSYKMND